MKIKRKLIPTSMVSKLKKEEKVMIKREKTPKKKVKDKFSKS